MCAALDACALPTSCDPNSGLCTIGPAPKVWQGNYDITDAASVAALAGFTAIDGSLFVTKSTTIASVTLPDLQRISGFLYVEGSKVTDLALPGLASVGQYVYFDNNLALASVGLGKLVSVCEYIHVDHALSLVDLDLGALQITGDSASFYRAGSPVLDLSSLHTVGGDLAFYHTTLTTLKIDSLATVDGFLYLDHNASLENLGPSPLTSVGGYFYADANTKLASFTLPSLSTVGDYMYVTNNGLKSLGLPKLATVDGYGYFANNAALPACSVAMLTAMFAGPVTNSGNNGVGPCD
ncbi:MAG: hypothetical protein IPO88_20815 [Nannocystis sp.]|uniref:hypothetical protein n=1 Tax=Nannocystis sp. TaxID=1962667 RepID=UPI002423903E|nr:hypothetical protein [Nannocystis sp.]MBK9755894.1 hypothetical protein [Nannocystis sp.]